MELTPIFLTGKWFRRRKIGIIDYIKGGNIIIWLLIGD